MAEGGAEKKDAIPNDDEHHSYFQNLSRRFADFLNIGSSEKDEKGETLLTSLDLHGVADFIKSSKCKNIITMAGAGISTSAGIPDFRSPGSGLYDNLASYNLPHPGAIFEIDFFRRNPEPFFVLAKNLLPPKLNPTTCHYFIRLLHKKGLLLRHYTQNVDALEREAGIPEEKLVEAHGTFQTGHCLKCRKEYTKDWMRGKLTEEIVPKCVKEGCKGVVKPDIIFFGENLPSRFFSLLSKDFKQCDLLIIMGTSLIVQPFASIIHKVKKAVPRLYINLENSTSSDDLSSLFGLGSGFRFGKANNYRDVFWKGTCDDGSTQLAKELGWEDELKGLVKGTGLPKDESK